MEYDYIECGDCLELMKDIPEGIFLSHIQSYLKFLILLILKALEQVLPC